MDEIRVTASELRIKGTASFLIDRPWGLGCFLLLRFHSPMEVLTAQGVVHAEPGNCLLYSPGHPQWYRGRHGAAVHDWMHLEGVEVAPTAARHGVPLNTLLTPSDTRFFPRLFEDIRHERLQTEAGYEEAVDLMARQLLLKLGRALRNPVAQFTPAEAAHLRSLRAFRQRLHEQLNRHWTVAEMAAEVGLSRPRFAALYQNFFQVSPGEDLLRARIQHAQYLLTNRAMTVREAANQCGFRSLHYFSHVFRQRVGCAPSDYYRRETLAEKQQKPLT